MKTKKKFPLIKIMLPVALGILAVKYLRTASHMPKKKTYASPCESET